MTRIIIATLLSITSIFGHASTPPQYDGTGTIVKLASIPSEDDRDYITVQNFISAGNCPVSSGLVIAKIKTSPAGNRAYSLALAAKMTGKQVKLVVNDQEQKNFEGFCYVKALEIIE